MARQCTPTLAEPHFHVQAGLNDQGAALAAFLFEEVTSGRAHANIRSLLRRLQVATLACTVKASCAVHAMSMHKASIVRCTQTAWPVCRRCHRGP